MLIIIEKINKIREQLTEKNEIEKHDQEEEKFKRTTLVKLTAQAPDQDYNTIEVQQQLPDQP